MPSKLFVFRCRSGVLAANSKGWRLGLLPGATPPLLLFIQHNHRQSESRVDLDNLRVVLVVRPPVSASSVDGVGNFDIVAAEEVGAFEDLNRHS